MLPAYEVEDRKKDTVVNKLLKQIKKLEDVETDHQVDTGWSIFQSIWTK